MKLCYLIVNSFFIFLACGTPTVVDIKEEKAASLKVSRFKGGVQAVPGAWPYQGYLKVERNILCGCSLLSTRWAVTAVHCTRGVPVKLLMATFGMVNRMQPTNGVQSFAIAKKIEHKKYSKNPTSHDICLLFLSHNAEETKYVRPIALPPQGFQAKVGQYCTLTGWGTTKDGSITSILQQASLPVLSHKQCSEWLPFLKMADTFLCAGLEAGGVDSCQGDSGGPLACYDAGSKQYYLQGITSFGYGCALARRPGIYVRVSSYTDWVKNNTDNFFEPRGSTGSTLAAFYRSVSLAGCVVGYTLWWISST